MSLIDIYVWNEYKLLIISILLTIIVLTLFLIICFLNLCQRVKVISELMKDQIENQNQILIRIEDIRKNIRNN